MVVSSIDGSEWKWTSDRNDWRSGYGDFGLLADLSVDVGDAVAAEVVRRPAGNEAIRILLPGMPASEVSKSARVEPWDRLAGRDLEPGDVVVAFIRFTKRPGAHDQASDGKYRPALVMSVDGDDVVVRPILGSSGAARGQGLGRRIKRWKDAGIRKPSVVSVDDRFLRRSDLGRRIGRLHAEDHERLLGDSSTRQ